MLCPLPADKRSGINRRNNRHPEVTFAQQAVKDEDRLADIREQLDALSLAHDPNGV